ncbi:unnamed protein product [Prorocentrum cordatum]|uniref:Uncharacterized protein n=1 Tax=Prorocentrum cordatum TaxID=2364126 RepID=A0ABN9RW23_9DINO|nr:unnamed protein product [Polarella glacialis]
MSAAPDRRAALAAARGATQAVHAAAGLARGTGAVRLLRSAEGICRAAVAKLEAELRAPPAAEKTPPPGEGPPAPAAGPAAAAPPGGACRRRRRARRARRAGAVGGRAAEGPSEAEAEEESDVVAAEAAAERAEASARAEAGAGGAAAAGSGGAGTGGAPMGLVLVRVPSAAEPTTKNEDEEMAELNDEWADTAPVRLAHSPPAGPASRRDAILAPFAVSPIFSFDPALAATWEGRTAEELEQLAPWLQDELAALGHAPCAPGMLGADGAPP